MAQHCTECGFVNADGANYCQKCGAYIGDRATGASTEPSTATYRIGETGEFVPVAIDEVAGVGGAALVIRSGGGRVGESFPLGDERVTVGRRPDSSIFLDDVTVSRDHAVIVHRQDSWWIDDLGSLNGSYVNRRRIDSHHLADGDELQIGKYKLTFFTGR